MKKILLALVCIHSLSTVAFGNEHDPIAIRCEARESGGLFMNPITHLVVLRAKLAYANDQTMKRVSENVEATYFSEYDRSSSRWQNIEAIYGVKLTRNKDYEMESDGESYFMGTHTWIAGSISAEYMDRDQTEMTIETSAGRRVSLSVQCKDISAFTENPEAI